MLRVYLTAGLLALLISFTFAQERQDSSSTNQRDSLKRNVGSASRDAAEEPRTRDRISNASQLADSTGKPDEVLELDAIAIEAVIEKPNVDIIPRRIRPELDEMRFIERSFQKELKKVPQGLLLKDEELDRAHKLDGLIKKAAEKKK